MTPQRWRAVLGWSQVACAALGLVATAWIAATAELIPHPVAYAAGSAIYMLVVLVAGVGLLRHRPWAIPLSACVQGPQLLWVGTPTFIAKFVCGLMVLLQVSQGAFFVRFGFEATALLGRNPTPQETFVVLNLFPLLALRGLYRLAREAPRPDQPAAAAATTTMTTTETNAA